MGRAKNGFQNVFGARRGGEQGDLRYRWYDPEFPALQNGRAWFENIFEPADAELSLSDTDKRILGATRDALMTELQGPERFQVAAFISQALLFTERGEGEWALSALKRAEEGFNSLF